MKYLILPSFLFVLACNSVDNVGLKGLSEDDKQYYRTLSKKKCEKDTEKEYQSFQDESNKQFENFTRKQKWTFKTALADVTTTTYYQIWKVGSKENGYPLFVIQNTPNTAGNQYRFIKITKDQNTELIQNIRTSLCDDQAEDTSYEFTNSNPPKVKNTDYRAGDVEDTRRKRVTEYLFNSKRPAYMGSLMLSVSERTVKKNSDEDYSKPDPKSYKTVETYVKEADLDFDDYRDYPNAQYCVVNTPSPFKLAYELSCETSADAGPDGWDVPSDDL